MSGGSTPVAVVTGAGNGIGRQHALALAAAGFAIVVNDLGVAVEGGEPSGHAAQDVAEEIAAGGGRAVANDDDVADWSGARHLIGETVDTFGRVDVLVANAGILRFRWLTEMTEADWDDLVRVHVVGAVAPLLAVAGHWRAGGEGPPGSRRVVVTTSQSGLYGMPGFSSYAAAKAAVAALVSFATPELTRLGGTVNAVAPRAHTRMTASLGVDRQPSDGGFDPADPANISPVVAWLAGASTMNVTGRIFEVSGGRVDVVEGWAPGPEARTDIGWDAEDLDVVMTSLLTAADPVPSVPLPAGAGGVFARVNEATA